MFVEEEKKKRREEENFWLLSCGAKVSGAAKRGDCALLFRGWRAEVIQTGLGALMRCGQLQLF